MDALAWKKQTKWTRSLFISTEKRKKEKEEKREKEESFKIKTIR